MTNPARHLTCSVFHPRRRPRWVSLTAMRTLCAASAKRFRLSAASLSLQISSSKTMRSLVLAKASKIALSLLLASKISALRPFWSYNVQKSVATVVLPTPCGPSRYSTPTGGIPSCSRTERSAVTTVNAKVGMRTALCCRKSRSRNSTDSAVSRGSGPQARCLCLSSGSRPTSFDPHCPSKVPPATKHHVPAISCHPPLVM